jgi:hypothetical protein
MPKDPIHQGFLETDIAIGLFAFEPFVTKNFFAFGGELGQEE